MKNMLGFIGSPRRGGNCDILVGHALRAAAAAYVLAGTSANSVWGANEQIGVGFIGCGCRRVPLPAGRKSRRDNHSVRTGEDYGDAKQ